MFTPLEQFVIKPIISIRNNWLDLTITNSTIYIGLVIITIIGLIKSTTTNSTLSSKNKWGYVIETLYVKIEEIVKETVGALYNKYTPLIMIIFLFILGNNMIGLIPYSFTTTAHFIITITMSLSIIIGVTIIGIKKHKLKFINLFIPNGLTGNMKYIIPIISFFEVVSYLIRIISLSVRLTANLMSGHTLLKIIANFGLKLSMIFPTPLNGIFMILVPVTFLSAIYLLEIGVAIIQAYVFSLLTITYIKDTELLH